MDLSAQCPKHPAVLRKTAQWVLLTGKAIVKVLVVGALGEGSSFPRLPAGVHMLDGPEEGCRARPVCVPHRAYSGCPPLCRAQVQPPLQPEALPPWVPPTVLPLPVIGDPEERVCTAPPAPHLPPASARLRSRLAPRH